MKSMTPKHSLGFVIIGRNEGERLKTGLRAIKSLHPKAPIIYVDSGSSDDSVAFANKHNIFSIELDMSVPVTAARARNRGFLALIEQNPDLRYVQFLDGDCELLPGWVDIAIDYLSQNKDTGIASGRRSERFPKASIYNQLIDIEWDTPPGEILGVPGDMCVKTETFNSINGFNETMIAGEDYDFCLRALQAGHKTFRIDANMSKHNASIMKLSQWYRRSKRGGHAYANLYHFQGKGSEQYFKREIKSILFWGALVPTLLILLLVISPALSLLILLGYVVFIGRIVARRRRSGDSFKIALAYSFLMLTGKTSELMGLLTYCKNHFLSRRHRLIEYK